MKLESTGEEYDYLGCPYPEGFIAPEQTFVFNHMGIEEVIHVGYVDEEEAVMQEVLKEKRPQRWKHKKSSRESLGSARFFLSIG